MSCSSFSSSNGQRDSNGKISRGIIEKYYDLGLDLIPLTQIPETRNKPAISFRHFFERGYGWESKDEMLQHLDKFENVAMMTGLKSHQKDKIYGKALTS